MPATSLPSALAIIRGRRMFVIFLLGFAAGVPLYLSGQTLQAWMTEANLALDQITAISAVGLAYTFKFLWAPLLDRYALPFLGRRRGWMLVLQLALVVAVTALGGVDVIETPGLLFLLALVVALLAASLDIVIDAYKVDLLAPEERGAGASAYIIGYRLSMIGTGTLALVLADHVSWFAIYVVMAAFLVVGIVAVVLAEEPGRGRTTDGEVSRPASIDHAVVEPFRDLFGRLGLGDAALVLVFVAIYKFGDYFAQAVLITFFKRGCGFDFTEIAMAYKLTAFAGMVVGGVAGAAIIAKLGAVRTLVAFGIIQAITNLLYAWLALVGDDLALLSVAVFVDNVTGAMGTAAFVAFLMGICSPAVSATQFALLTSLSSIGQRVFGHFADEIVDAFDWHGFFLVTAAMAIPGIVLAGVVAYRDRCREVAPSRGDP